MVPSKDKVYHCTVLGGDDIEVGGGGEGSTAVYIVM
jgi:hypothetical protein